MFKSALFEPYRSVGVVTGSVPFSLNPQGEETFISVAAGRSWQIFKASNLRPVICAPQRARTITAITSMRDVNFTACGREIIIWRRTHEVARLPVSCKHHVNHLLTIGYHLLAVTDTNHLYLWDFTQLAHIFSSSERANMHASAPAMSVKGEQVLATGTGAGIELVNDLDALKPTRHIEFPRPIDDPDAYITSIVHPPAYVNKVVVGWSNGTLELWNFNSEKMIHRFRGLSAALVSHKTSVAELLANVQEREKMRQQRLQQGADFRMGAITVIAKSHVPDVVAVGLSTGEIVVMNLKLDKSITVFAPKDGAITGLAFRTDERGDSEHPKAFLASGNASGHITIWDLNEKRVHSVIRSAHSTTITKLEFLMGEPILISSGGDNAIRAWIFDNTDDTGRLLRQRSGHALPPTHISFYNENWLLSAGADRSLRGFNLVREQMSTEFSQGSIVSMANRTGKSVGSLKLPPITCIASNPVRERDWPTIVTTHANDSAARAWSFEKKTLEDSRLMNIHAGRAATATSCSVSACGNYSVLGYSDGRIERFNVQSGGFHGRFGRTRDRALSVTQQRALNKAAVENAKEAIAKGAGIDVNDEHTLAVTGVHVDALNRVVSSTSLDGTVRFWDFNTYQLIEAVNIGCPIAKSTLCKESGLLAAATDDLKVHILDTETHKVVRRYTIGRRATSMTFSPDGRTLVVAQANGEVRVFDLPSGRLVDWFTFDRPVVSLAFSPRGEFLATVHVATLGVFLWSNRSYFSTDFLGLSVPKRPTQMYLKSSQVFSEDVEEEAAAVEEEKAELEKIAKRRHKRSSQHRQTGGEETSDSELESEDDGGDEDAEDDESNEFDPIVFAMQNPVDPEQMTSECWGDLITLSGLPASKWQQLSMLEQIRARNKPKEEVKVNTQAPFFLSVAAGTTPTFDTRETAEAHAASVQQQELERASRILVGQVGLDDYFTKLLAMIPVVGKGYTKMMDAVDREVELENAAALQDDSGDDGHVDDSDDDEVSRILGRKRQHSDSEDDDDDEDDEDDEDNEDHEDEDEDEDADNEEDSAAFEDEAVDNVTKHLMSLSPANLDAELRALAIGKGERSEVPKLWAVMQYLLLATARRRHYEFVQAVTHLFLKIHTEAVGAHRELARVAKKIELLQKSNWRHLEGYLNSSLCMLEQFCNMRF